MNEWFSSWFNSDEYLQVYKHRNSDDAAKLVDLILKTTEIKRNAKVLDLACGAGRHSILFAKNGFDVTGIDLSDNLLNIGRSNAMVLNLDINFLHCDIRNIRIMSSFDLVTNLFTSFGYFENDDENFGIFQTAYHYLVNSGFFVFDFLNSKYIIENLVPFSEDTFDNYKVIQKRKIIKDSIIKNIRIESTNSFKEFHESVKLYSSDRLIQNITNSGFTIDSIFGNYDGDGFKESSSPRFVAICKK